MKLRPRTLAGLAAIILIAIVLLLRRGDDRFERYLAGHRAKGEKFTHQELWAIQSTNGAPGTTNFLNAATAIQTGLMEPGNILTMGYSGPGTASPAWRQTQIDIGNRIVPGTWDALAGQLETNRAIFAQLRAALDNPPLDTGLDRRANPFGPSANFVSQRKAAQWLAAAALNDLHRENREAALANLHALVQLVRMHHNELTLVNHMIRVAVARIALDATWEALQAGGWTDAQLAALQRDWQSIDLLDNFERGILGERAMGMAAREELIQSNVTRRMAVLGVQPSMRDRLLHPLWRSTMANTDFIFYFDQLHESLEAVRRLRAGEPWPVVQQQFDAGQERLSGLQDSLKGSLYWFSGMALPNFSRAALTATRNETQRRMTVVAIALKRCQLKHGRHPAGLAALAPEFLAEIPRDPMAGAPFQYRLEKDSGFTLYSVGEDGKDDGGDATPSAPGSKRFGLWECQDAVWPKGK
ncbi:MAG: hypothetical protein AB1705_16915 [Verrucomicrobiota bacterium]